MDLRVSPEDAAAMGLTDLRAVTVRAGTRAAKARLCIARELGRGAVVLPEWSAEARALAPAEVDRERNMLLPRQLSVSIEA
jgi:predicted molibdopterin-dependent oxidoreductase YjgC